PIPRLNEVITITLWSVILTSSWLGSHGFCDLTHCQTVPNRKKIQYLVGARLLEKLQTPLISLHGVASPSCRSIAFEANLIGHCYVKLEDSRVLSQIEL